ncbi:MAG: hypothetical protein M3N95_10885 [Actinomycetota bacterium]|nr:hypothetical protein [Actinomycetota bacterium]
MTALAELVASPERHALRWNKLRGTKLRWTKPPFSPAYYPAAVGLAMAIAFVVVRPQVGDLWAARARQSAASHGVGLTYWFSWFAGGSTPGGYSVLTPLISVLLGSVMLGAIATASIAPLCWWLARGSGHPLAATWIATITAGASLWSGRIPFAVGTAVSILALIAVREDRRWLAALLTALTVLLSPVSGAFIAIGLTGVAVYSRPHRTISLTTIAAAVASLVVVAVVFGAPGPEGFTASNAALTAGALVLLLAARPPKYLASVIVLSILACPLIVAVPNGMGSNFQRFVWICLPVAVVATARVRLLAALVAGGLAVISGVTGTVDDLRVARSPLSSPAYYAPLARELDSIPAMTNYRLEAVPDGAHTASYALLGHAMLARGYETQADNAFNAVLMSNADLNAVTFKIWLDNNAVGYVAIGKTAIHPSPEFNLVSKGNLGYLSSVWSDADWTLYRVENPTSIVAAPATIIDAEQSRLEVSVPDPGPIPIRIRWSHFLAVTPPKGVLGATLAKDSAGWTILTVPTAGTYILHG